jgi:hypothetical protein
MEPNLTKIQIPNQHSSMAKETAFVQRNIKDSLAFHKPKNQISELENYDLDVAQVGTFDPPNFQDLIRKTKEIFKTHQNTLCKLSSNGVFTDLHEDDIDMQSLIKDLLFTSDLYYKQSGKAVLKSLKSNLNIQKLIKEKVSILLQ